jgi:GntR family transcriptional regulator of vanillate catabolism
LAQSHEILVVAQHQHWQLIESIRERHGTRAEEITREHARLSRLNLDLVLENSEARDRMPGAPLLTEVA